VIPKSIDNISKADIDGLVTDKRSESKTLEYKLQLNLQNPEEKREFLSDVASFANAEGGDIVFGVADERDGNGKATGIAASAPGLSVENISDEIARIENMLRDSVDPRLAGIRFKPVNGFPNGPVLVMRIHRSWIGPHMVAPGGSKFYSRNSTGKYALNAGQIRTAFLAASVTGERLRQFRLTRIAHAIENSLPVELPWKLKMLFHLIPLSALDPTNVRDVASGTAKEHYIALAPVSKPGGYNFRYNFEGWIGFSAMSHSYVQLFRSGIVEAAEGELLRWAEQAGSLPVPAIESSLVDALNRFLGVQRELDLPLPVAAMLTLIGVKELPISIPKRFYSYSKVPIGHDVLQIPEVIIDNFDTPAHVVLRPIFDMLWQSGGYEKSLSYDDDGNWKAGD
jgi:hypothetical protein